MDLNTPSVSVVLAIINLLLMDFTMYFTTGKKSTEKKHYCTNFAYQPAHQSHVLISVGTSSPCLPALWRCIILQIAASCLLGTGSESEPTADRLTLMAPIWLFFKDSIQSD